MNWVSDILKHLTVSRSFVVAIFVTSGVLLFGRVHFPTVIKPLPDQWHIVASGALVFTSVLLLWWIVPAIWKTISKLYNGFAQRIGGLKLSGDEKSLLIAMGHLADEALDLRFINYKEVGLTKLEVLQLSKKLSRKGLVRINFMEENLLTLTQRGRERALKLHREESQQENA